MYWATTDAMRKMTTILQGSEGWNLKPIRGILTQPVIPFAVMPRPGIFGIRMRKTAMPNRTFV